MNKSLFFKTMSVKVPCEATNWSTERIIALMNWLKYTILYYIYTKGAEIFWNSQEELRRKLAVEKSRLWD